MTTALKLRRGTTAQHSSFTGAEGEVTVDTTKDTVVVHDGATAGGFPLVKEANPSYTGTLTGGTGVVNLGSGQLYKAADGKVGIGTASPAQKLQIGVGGSNDYLQFGATNEGFVVGRENASGQFISNATQASPYNVWRWQQGGTDRLVINASGTLELTSGQLKFPATQSASSDANTLDDYEEGTFTPTYYGSTTAGTTTYDLQSAFYTKIGRVVYFNIRLNWTNATGTGQARVGGLPFLGINSYFAATILGESYAAGSGNTLFARTGFGIDYLELLTMPTSGGAVSTASMDTAAGLFITGFYFV